MLRAFVGSLTLAILFLPAPGMASARPPEGASGKMVLDEVADGLRKYRKEPDPERRLDRLTRLAPTGDPRVAVALAEAMNVGEWWYRGWACTLLFRHFENRAPIERHRHGDLIDPIVERWWKENEADLRRRAAQLPR
jgi:hypothetical protein